MLEKNKEEVQLTTEEDVPAELAPASLSKESLEDIKRITKSLADLQLHLDNLANYEYTIDELRDKIKNLKDAFAIKYPTFVGELVENGYVVSYKPSPKRVLDTTAIKTNEPELVKKYTITRNDYRISIDNPNRKIVKYTKKGKE